MANAMTPRVQGLRVAMDDTASGHVADLAAVRDWLIGEAAQDAAPLTGD